MCLLVHVHVPTACMFPSPYTLPHSFADVRHTVSVCCHTVSGLVPPRNVRSNMPTVGAPVVRSCSIILESAIVHFHNVSRPHLTQPKPFFNLQPPTWRVIHSGATGRVNSIFSTCFYCRSLLTVDFGRRMRVSGASLTVDDALLPKLLLIILPPASARLRSVILVQY